MSVGFLWVLQCSWLFQEHLFFHNLRDSLILACSHYPHSHFALLHYSHNTSWQKCHSCHPHLNPCHSCTHLHDRIPSTTPGAEPPRDDRDSGSARSHSTHLETSSSDRPKMVTYTEPQTVSSYMSVKCTRRTLRMPNFTRATHAQPSLSDFPWRDSEFWRADPLTRDDPGGTKFSHFPPK